MEYVLGFVEKGFGLEEDQFLFQIQLVFEFHLPISKVKELVRPQQAPGHIRFFHFRVVIKKDKLLEQVRRLSTMKFW